MPEEIRTLGSMHMSMNTLYEPQRQNNFEIQITGVEGTEHLTLSVVSAPQISIANEPVEVPHGNSRVKFAGQATMEGGDVVVQDSIGADVEQIIYKWQNKVYNPATDQIGWAADYKKNAHLLQYAPDGSHIREWKLWGVWPSNVTYGEFSYDGGDRKQITMTLQYDRVVMTRVHDFGQEGMISAIREAAKLVHKNNPSA